MGCPNAMTGNLSAISMTSASIGSGKKEMTSVSPLKSWTREGEKGTLAEDEVLEVLSGWINALLE